MSSGTYNLSETVPDGWSKTGDTCQGVSISSGATSTCTITNTKKGRIIVDKVTSPSEAPQSFSFTVGGSGYEGFSLTDTATPNDQKLDLGSYTVTEDATEGWDLSDLSCTDPSNNSSVDLKEAKAALTLDAGETINCTFTNTKRGGILVQKAVENPEGSAATDNHSFTVTRDGGNAQSVNENSSASYSNLAPGTYTIAESADADYNLVSISPDNDSDPSNGAVVTVSAGATTTVTITNKQKLASLTVIKHVNNPNGGVKTPADFTMHITATNVSQNDFAGDGTTGTPVTLDPGSYSVGETGPGGYSLISADNCSGTLASGGSATCTITNSDIPDGDGAITVIKRVVSDNGGELSASDFTIHVTDSSEDDVEGSPADGSSSGTLYTLEADNSYTVSENDPAAQHYALTGVSCVPVGGGEAQTGGSVTLDLADQQAYICTITNNDDAPSLTLQKIVDTEENGGSAVAADWTLSASSTKDSSFGISGQGEVASTTFQAGTYTLFESGGPEGYTAGAWSCDGGSQDGNSITLGLGDKAICTITNTSRPATLTIVKDAAGADGTFNFHIASSTDGAILTQNKTLTTVGGFATSSPITLKAGTYDVIEDAQSGWGLTGTSCVYGGDSVGTPLPAGGETITVDPGDSVVCTFTNERGVFLTGAKWEDTNGNGAFDKGEHGVAGWIINAIPITGEGTTTADKTRSATSTTTDENGDYKFKFSPSDFGWWRISEATSTGWVQTSTTTATYDVHVTGDSEDLSGKNFGNWNEPRIVITKWNDANNNGARDEGEQGISGVTIGLGKVTGGTEDAIDVEMLQMQLTGGDGTATLSVPGPGHYVVLEENQSGWTVTSPAAATHKPLVVSRADGVPTTPEFRTDSFFDVFVSVDGGVITGGQPGTGEVPLTTTSVPLTFGNHQTALVISAQIAANPAPTSFTVTWLTDHPATSRVIYDTVSHPVLGTAPNYGYANSTVEDAATTTSHSVVVTGLTEGTTYFFRSVSHGSPETVSSEFSGTTSSPPPSPGPSAPPGGGNGPIVGSFGLGGRVLGASSTGPTVGQVLGASTSTSPSSCTALLTEYMRRGKPNDPDQVRKLQTFLNGEMRSGLPVSGFFGSLTEAAVKAFQMKYATDILNPWGLTQPTGYVFKLTEWKLNAINCASLNTPRPSV